jgi:catalase (peroxidase I)
MMLPSDIVLTQDPKFAEWALKYKADEDLFFKDFAAAFGKLLALGTAQAKTASGSSNGGGGGYWGQLKGLVGLK